MEPSATDSPNVGEGDAKVTLGDFELLKVIGRGTYGKVRASCCVQRVHARGAAVGAGQVAAASRTPRTPRTWPQPRVRAAHRWR
eukprot:4859897-Prymnesium_polylepis.1